MGRNFKIEPIDLVKLKSEDPERYKRVAFKRVLASSMGFLVYLPFSVFVAAKICRHDGRIDYDSFAVTFLGIWFITAMSGIKFVNWFAVKRFGAVEVEDQAEWARKVKAQVEERRQTDPQFAKRSYKSKMMRRSLAVSLPVFILLGTGITYFKGGTFEALKISASQGFIVALLVAFAYSSLKTRQQFK